MDPTMLAQSIAQSERVHLPDLSSLSAHELWHFTELAFAERKYNSVFANLVSSSHSACGSDRTYVERFTRLRSEMSKMGYVAPDWIWTALLRIGLHDCHDCWIQSRLRDEQSVNNPENNFDGFIRDLPVELPAARNNTTKISVSTDSPAKSVSISGQKTNNAGDKTKKSKGKQNQQSRQSTDHPTCFKCGQRDNTQVKCWYDEPRSAPDWWRQKHLPTGDIPETKKDVHDAMGQELVLRDSNVSYFVDTPSPGDDLLFGAISNDGAQNSETPTSDIQWGIDSYAGAHATGRSDILSEPCFAKGKTMTMANGVVSPVHRVASFASSSRPPKSTSLTNFGILNDCAALRHTCKSDRKIERYIILLS